jgi:hypothetical protein
LISPIHINGVTQALEGIEGNAYGENKAECRNFIGEMIVDKEGLERRIKEIIIFKYEQEPEIGQYRKNEKLFSLQFYFSFAHLKASVIADQS